MTKKHSKDSFFLTLSLILILGLSGCASYKARPLSQLSTDSSTLFIENNSICFGYHIFDKSDCKKYLDRDVITKGYQPIHISITNNSNSSVYFSPKNITLPIIDAYEVSQKAHTNTVGRAVGYGITGLFIWPFLIPAVVDGIGSHEANDKLDVDFDRKVLRDQTINPNASINGLVFVPVESNISDFQITLTDSKTLETITLNTNQPKPNEFYA